MHIRDGREHAAPSALRAVTLGRFPACTRANLPHPRSRANKVGSGDVDGVKRGHLRYFVTVAEEGQITRAAKKVHIAQPALSQAIAQLEADLGVELLTRHARGVTLTAAGEAFLAKARIALAADDDAAQTARWLARATRGAMDVGFVGPPPTLTAPELFATFGESYPDAEVSYRDLPFPRGTTLSWLEEVDVAFCHLPASDPDVEIQAVRLEPRVFVAHDSHPLAQRAELTVADVLDETFLSYRSDVQPAWAGFTVSMTIAVGHPEKRPSNARRTPCRWAG